MYTVKLNVNLKVSSVLTVQKGHVFRGPFEELPEFIKPLVKGNSRLVEYTKENIVEVPKDDGQAELDFTPEKVEPPVAPAKPKSIRKRQTLNKPKRVEKPKSAKEE